MNFKRTVLPNGLRVILVPMKDSLTATVLVMVEAGSKYETKAINGLSHFLEHMCFKGTEKRPTALAISKELDSLGSYYNAFTGEEFTGYFAKSSPKHVHALLDVVSDIYLNSTFPDQEIEKEKGVIVEEINMYHDLPHQHVQELFMKLMYGDQPAGWGIAGTKEVVLAMKRDNFCDYHAKHYVAPATTVIVSGNFNEKETLKLIKEKFGKLSKNKKAKKVKVKEAQVKPRILIEQRSIDQTHIVLGVKAYPVGSKLLPAAKVLNAVLGAGMSSRLFQKLREEMGVGYYVRSSCDAYTDHGLLTVSIGCDTKRVEEVIKAIIDELERFKRELVSKEELHKTKEYVIGTMFLGLESSDSLAEFYGYQEIFNQKLRKPEDLVKEIKKVTSQDIRNIARKIFVTKHLNIAAVGPMPHKEKVEVLLRF
jgi:predicted Zn-dependent peptidase